MPHLTLPALLSALLVLSVTAVSGQKAKPNIILLYADDLGYTDLSCQGSDYYRTPNIARLAKE
nr:sulfatase [Roseibacillus sp.]